MKIDVIKRDGKVVEFNKDKIENAIIKSMISVGEKNFDGAKKIVNKVSKNIKSDEISVEEIQDLVENALMKSSYTEVAKAYIKYREERTKIRRKKSDINKHIKEILNCSNIQNQNANIDEFSFGARKNESANILQKQLALDEFISPDVAQAHEENRIYIHDLCEYTSGMHNCLFANVAKLEKNGFSTRNGDVRGANSFSTACQLLAVMFQVQSQC
jgi:ribonucleoside-triphosphate reductase